mgnify:CR=1 FL=1
MKLSTRNMPYFLSSRVMSFHYTRNFLLKGGETLARKSRDNYFVSFTVKTRLGNCKGRKTFKDFKSAQDFAVKVDRQKSANLGLWGTIHRRNH